MNCELVQRRLLAAEGPAQPAAEVRRHLAECPSCRAWHRRLVETEQQLPLLPVPPSERKDEVVQLILNSPQPADNVHTRNGYIPMPRFGPTARERGLRKAAVAIALAAALAVFALGWSIWPRSSPVTPKIDPLDTFYRDRDEKLASAHTPQARVEVVTTLVDNYRGKALLLAQKDDATELANVAKFYTVLVTEDLPNYAKTLPHDERKKFLEAVAEQLIHMDSDLDRTAAEVKGANRESLKQMAVVTRQCRDRLLDIMRG
jgi:hypothetical protein